MNTTRLDPEHKRRTVMSEKVNGLRVSESGIVGSPKFEGWLVRR